MAAQANFPEMTKHISVLCGCRQTPSRKSASRTAHRSQPSRQGLFRDGFTLTELLIVVAIIGVLVALMFPTLGSLRDKAMSAKCAGNLRGIGSAIAVNVSENNGKWLVMDQMYGSWDITMRDRGILTTDKTSFCPSCDPKTYQQNQTYGATWMGYTAVPEDQNVLLYSTNSAGTRTYFEINMMKISQPSKFLIMADSYTTRFKTQYHIIQGNSGMDEIHLRHNNRANALFADGHVGALDWKGLKEIGYRMAFTESGVLTNF